MEHKNFIEDYYEIMYDERDAIESFLKKQYDLRYGHQRDSWHFEPAVEIMSGNGEKVVLHDIKLDDDVFVKFNVETNFNPSEWWECTDFAFGELSKVIEALPNAEDIVWNNALTDLNEQNITLRLDLLLTEHPLVYESSNGTVRLDGHDICSDYNFTVLGEKYGLDFLVTLRDHIHIEVLHRYDEYKKLVKFLSEQPNLRFEPADWGHVMFTIHGTDVKVDVLSASLDSNGKLQLCVDDDNKEAIYLEEKDIRPEYLVDLVGYIEDHCRCDIMDTYNGHNAELVRKINAAWKNPKYHDSFCDILFAITKRDMDMCSEKDVFGESVVDVDNAMTHAHEIMYNVCDDQDLETILGFIRYDEE